MNPNTFPQGPSSSMDNIEHITLMNYLKSQVDNPVVRFAFLAILHDLDALWILDELVSRQRQTCYQHRYCQGWLPPTLNDVLNRHLIFNYRHLSYSDVARIRSELCTLGIDDVLSLNMVWCREGLIPPRIHDIRRKD